MKLLLDTHIVIWAIMDDPRLTNTAKALIDDNAGECFFSAASVWEVAVKNSIPRRFLGIHAGDFTKESLQMGLRNMDVTTEHAEIIETLPYYHDDPFDRMLIAQAMAEDCILVTHDDKLPQYGAFVRKV
ncbi:MAG: type II toxin-antitoxin system VapC family toxin [Kiritimatiellae bacterium]|nr:type II toxin-antitoxin system VapC family toxin [Kiritimatiellia bacterium]